MIGGTCRLERLILSANEIQCIDPPSVYDMEESGRASPIHNLTYLAVSFNGLRSWSDIDNLCCWCPHLEALKVSGNPLTEGL